VAFADLTAKPTTLSGYGITDAQSSAAKGVANGYASLDAAGKLTPAQAPAVAFADLTAKPSTLSGYGITDAQSSAAKGVANGYASLDAAGKLTATQAPAVAFADLTAKPTTLSGYGITDALGLGSAQTVTGAKTFSAPVVLSGLATDPASPSNGSIWYNATTAQLKAQVGGSAKVVQTGQDIPWLIPASGECMSPTLASHSANTAAAPSANQIRLFPFTARADTAITGLALIVTTGAAASLAKCVVYDSDANGRPNALLAETADMDCTTAGTKTAAVALTLRRGQTYWLGIRTNGTAALSVWPPSATPDINGGSPSTSPYKQLLRAVTYATPAPVSWGWNAAERFAGYPSAVWLVV